MRACFAGDDEREKSSHAIESGRMLAASENLINFTLHSSTSSYRRISDTSCTVPSDPSTFRHASWCLCTYEFIMRPRLVPEGVYESNRESHQMNR